MPAAHYVDDHSSPADEQGFQQAMTAQRDRYRLARAFGLVRLIGASQSGTHAMTAEIRLEMALFASGQRGLDATTAEGLQRAADDAHLGAASSLGERPLTVLAAEQSMEHLPYWAEAQRRQAALNTNRRLIVAAGSGHSIHWEQPALVVDAVRHVVAQIRGR